MLPEVQKELYNYDLDGASPICSDLERIVKKDEKGQEVISFVGVNYKEIEKSRPTVEYFDLDSMIKAGVDPRSSIRTGLNSRIEGESYVEDMANKIFESLDKSE